MNNLQIIIAGTLFSVTLIESILMNIRLKKALKRKSTTSEISPQRSYQKGFVDPKTGRRVDIDPMTRKETFVDRGR